ncbi:MAG: right-handed parallel beta-helix repeat-containing protein [Clostridia bacterium]|nr:right-handed parallel beta-helix repeat-containing protein [Clostridia bacterium]
MNNELIKENFSVLSGRTVENLTVSAAGVTLKDLQINGTLVLTEEAKDVLVLSCRVGNNLACAAEGVELRDCTFTGDVALDGAKNIMLAKCTVTGALSLYNVYNVSVLRSTLASVAIRESKNVYVCHNEIKDDLSAVAVNYLLADGNTVEPEAVSLLGCDNLNGDTVTDVNERIPCGANEKILPHVNRELFVGMERQDTVRDTDGALPIYDYIEKQAAAEREVFVRPGVYRVNKTLSLGAEHSNTVLYAYGVYAEAVFAEEGNYAKHHFRLNHVEGFAFYGITIGYAQQSCGQAYVLEKQENNRLLLVSGAGMWQEFAGSGSPYMNVMGIGIQKAGTFYAQGDFGLKTIEKNEDGTMTAEAAENTYKAVEPGDVLTCRLSGGRTTVEVTYSGNISFTDMTLYGYAGGFAYHEAFNVTGTKYLRVYDSTRTGEIIEKEEYDRYRALEKKHGVSLEISVDELGRHRGSLPHIGSIDATHTSKCAKGSQITSCIFENMCDDGTNQNAAHARLSELIDNGDGTTTVVYKGNMSAFSFGRRATSFGGLCAPFRVGDRLFIYTSAGQLVCDTPTLSATVDHTPVMSTHPDVPVTEIVRYSVTVPTKKINFDALRGFDLTDDTHHPDHKVLVDNMSLASNCFLFDNMMVQNVRSRGLLIKASEGVIRNCTFRNIAKVAVAIVYEIFWGESGVSENLVVENNLIDHTSYSPNTSIYKHIPIDIMGLGGQSIDPDFLLYKNIVIRGNKFVNRCLKMSPYAIYVQAGCDVTIEGNDFDGVAVETDESYGKAILLSGAMNVNLSGNTYPSRVRGNYAEMVEGEHYKNVFGTDLGGKLPDKA